MPAPPHSSSVSNSSVCRVPQAVVQKAETPPLFKPCWNLPNTCPYSPTPCTQVSLMTGPVHVTMTRVVVVLLMQLMAIQGTAACVAVTNASKLVTWDTPLRGCNPPVCGACRLSDIAGADGALPISLAQRMTLYDTASARKLMTGKRVTLLGDSSMAETAHDLVLLISGVTGTFAIVCCAVTFDTHARTHTQCHTCLLRHMLPLRGMCACCRLLPDWMAIRVLVG